MLAVVGPQQSCATLRPTRAISKLQLPKQPITDSKTPPKLSGFKPDPLLASLPSHIQVYVVGGAVRDELLGRPQSDKDWVLVGAKPEDLLPLGFKPVGADFPVFLHPHTQDEYALARTERKSGHGYKGFTFYASPDVTLQQDLERRDFTVNAMAMAEDGHVIDPFNGFSDLNAGVMRHVSPAFAEDPLRILRLARFLARFTEFTVADETLALCQQLVDSGEITHLVPERVFAELNKGMSEPMPSRMIELLIQLKAWRVLVGGLAINSQTNNHLPIHGQAGDVHQQGTRLLELTAADLQQLDALQAASTTLAEARWIYLLGCFERPEKIAQLAQTLRMPSQLADEARVAAQALAFFSSSVALAFSGDAAKEGLSGKSPHSLIEFFSQVDVYRKPERLLKVLSVLRQFQPTYLEGGVSNQDRERGPLNFTAAAVDTMLRAANEQLSGAYKTRLREYMASHSGERPEQLVAQFRSDWAAQVLKY